MSDLSDRTRLIATATRRGQGRRPVNPPLERASTMLSDDPSLMQNGADGPVYGLDGTSAARNLRAAIADLEGAAHSLLVPSGLACVTLPLMALLKPGDEVIASDALYGPTRRFLNRYMASHGIKTIFHPAETSADELVALIGENTRVVLLESPASLTFEVMDVQAVTQACRSRGILTIIDNTWAAGLAFKPLAFGVDVSVQALTKYAGGHSDLLMGSICVSDPGLGRIIENAYEDMGWHVSPDDAWLALRGLRTLPVRMKEQFRSALELAKWLETRPQISRVLYPALPGSVGHELWKRDYSGGAALMGLVMKGGDTEAAHSFMRQLELFGMGYSWGGFESLITHETGQLLQRRNPPKLEGELLRIHIGLEDPSDLMKDLEGALQGWPM